MGSSIKGKSAASLRIPTTGDATASTGTTTDATSSTGTTTAATSSTATTTDAASSTATTTDAASSGTTTTADAASSTATGLQRTTTTAAAESAATKAVVLDTETDAVDARTVDNKFVPKLTAEVSASDKEILEGMEKLGHANLVNTATMRTTYSKLTSATNLTEYGAAVDAVRTATVDTSSANVSRAADFINKLSTSTGSNMMEVLFFVFRESIQATNEDKKYFLEKLTDYNTMAEKLSDYLSELVDSSQELSEAASGAKYPEKVTIEVQVKTFDLTTLATETSDRTGADRLLTLTDETKTLDRSGLNDTIKDVESMQETVRNKRQMASTAFQNFDQKANQLYNLMSSVLKAMNEMRSGVTRNML